MKVLLLRVARIRHQPGEIVEVSPDEYQYLTSTGSAVGADNIETPDTKAVETRKRGKKS